MLCADGATSKLATALGYCTEPPRGVCSRAFVEGGTHNTDFDGKVSACSVAAGYMHAGACRCLLGSW